MFAKQYALFLVLSYELIVLIPPLHDEKLRLQEVEREGRERERERETERENTKVIVIWPTVGSQLRLEP